LNQVDPYPIHNLEPFKPITCNLSSEKTGFKVCLSNANQQRYITLYSPHLGEPEGDVLDIAVQVEFESKIHLKPDFTS
jgi:hypothetical protein